MYAVLIGLIILISVLLVLVVLAQNPKGGGLSSQFGGSGATQIMGVKQTGDILEKLTWGFAIAIMVLTLATNFFISEPSGDVISSPNIDNAQQQQPAIPDFNLESGSEGSTSTGVDDLGLTEPDSAN